MALCVQGCNLALLSPDGDANLDNDAPAETTAFVNPATEVTRLADADIATDAPVQAMLTTEPTTDVDTAAGTEPSQGLFGRLFNRNKNPLNLPDQQSTASDRAVAEALGVTLDPSESAKLAATDGRTDAPTDLATASAADPAPLATDVKTTSDGTTTAETSVKLASIAPDPTSPDTAILSDAKPKRGLGRLLGNILPETKPLADPIGPQPLGELVTACDTPKRQYGKKIAGRDDLAGFILYDSDPTTTEPRDFFLTGFDDGCARRFTAAVALLGDLNLHETMRYALPASVLPYSKTDTAYETVKRKICAVPKGKPCGDKFNSLEKSTAMLTVYETFGGTGEWAEILIHKGKVLAADVETLADQG